MRWLFPLVLLCGPPAWGQESPVVVTLSDKVAAESSLVPSADFLDSYRAKAVEKWEKAIGELYQVQEVEPSLIDTAKRMIAELEGRKVVQKRVVSIKAPVPKPKPKPRGRAVQYAPGPAQMEPLVVL